ncbi:MAG: glycosyltransferase family 87 protein [Ruegeria sp.]
MHRETWPSNAGLSAADARLRIFDSRRGWQLGALVPAFFVIVVIIWFGYGWWAIANSEHDAMAIDFTVFWSAAKLAFAGDPVAAFDPDNLAVVHGVQGDVWMPWLYPPGFMLAILPLGAFSFPVALLIFVVLSGLAMLAAVRPFAGGVTPVWIGFAFAPAAFPALVVGQTSVLWIACLLAALAALRGGRPIMAGVLIGFLTLKPQLGLLIPVALLACFAWRTVVSAAVTTILLAAISTFIMGVDYWIEMNSLAQHHFERVRDAASETHLMTSVYSVLAGIGFPEPSALAAQWMTTALAAVIIAIAWSSPKIEFDLRAATLLLGIMVSSPYFWHYETAILAPTSLFLLRAGVLTESRFGLLLAALMWLGVAPAMAILLLTDIRSLPVRFMFAPVALAAIVFCVTAIVRRIRSPLSAPFAS